MEDGCDAPLEQQEGDPRADDEQCISRDLKRKLNNKEIEIRSSSSISSSEYRGTSPNTYIIGQKSGPLGDGERTLLVGHERGTLVSPGLDSRYLLDDVLSLHELFITIRVVSSEDSLLIETPADQSFDQLQGIVVRELEKE